MKAYQRDKDKKLHYYKKTALKKTRRGIPVTGSLDYRRNETKHRLIIELLSLLERKSYDEANQIVDNLPAQLMEHADFLYLAGETKRAVGELKRASGFLTEALRYEAHSPNVYLSLGRVCRA